MRIGAFIRFALCTTPLVFPLTRLAPADGVGATAVTAAGIATVWIAGRNRESSTGLARQR